MQTKLVKNSKQVVGMLKSMTLGQITILAKVYTLEYILTVPPSFAKGNPKLWKYVIHSFILKNGLNKNRLEINWGALGGYYKNAAKKYGSNPPTPPKL